mgnify:CR=1 FL=1
MDDQENRYQWVEFYMELADKLLDYKDNRSELIDKIYRVFDTVGMKAPKLEHDGIVPTDIDPFSIFGLFNKGLSTKTRSAIAQGFASEFSIKADVPNLFNGVPILNNFMSLFYAFSNDSRRHESDIDNLWAVAQAAINYADDRNAVSREKFVSAYDKVLSQFGISWSFTFALYWMRPFAYVGLDSRNRNFLVVANNATTEIAQTVSSLKQVPRAEEYLSLCNTLKHSFESGSLPYSSFPELSFTAWNYTNALGETSLNGSYTPGITQDEWFDLLKDPSVTKKDQLTALRCLYEAGKATCTELSQRFGKTKNFYNSNISGFAKKVAKKTGCILSHWSDGSPAYWSVCCLGEDAAKDQPGSSAWELRPELKEALKSLFDEEGAVSVSGIENESSDQRNYWWIVANPNYWSFDSIKVGETVKYTSYNDSGHKRRYFKYFQEAQPGDLVVGYHSSPIKQVVCLCEVLSALDDESEDVLDRGIMLRKVAEIPRGLTLDELREDSILSRMEYLATNPTGTLFRLTKEEYEHVVDLTERPDLKPYTDADFLDQVYIDAEELATLKTLLRRKKNLILQGSPGTGKTFLSKRLAYSMMGEVDPKRIEMIQFHQSSTYDEFVIGYRPTENGSFKAQPGIFVRFCNKADADSDHDYFFIIDEINRANISKVFGELLMLIESDHRGETVSLSVEGYDFKVPDNVYIIGMMNTADRGLALIDYALRRRFAFYEMKPAFENINFQSKLVDNERLVALSNAIVELNKRITEDPALGRGFCIGHSYFCGNDISDKDADLILDYELIPLLEEYWFDDPDKVMNEVTLLKAAIS